MECYHCSSKKLIRSRSQPLFVRILWLLLLCRKFRCSNCRKSQMRFLPQLWLYQLTHKENA